MAKTLEDLQVLRTAEDLADGVWRQTVAWNSFQRDTVGKQLTRSVDSIGANIAEAFGRFHYGEKLQFLYYARGSVFETKYWLNRVNSRQLMPSNDVQQYINQIGVLTQQLKGFLAHIKRQRQDKSNPKLQTIGEESIRYEIEQLHINNLFNQEEIHSLESINNQ